MSGLLTWLCGGQRDCGRKRWLAWQLFLLGLATLECPAVIRLPQSETSRSDRVLVGWKSPIDSTSTAALHQSLGSRVHRAYLQEGRLQVVQLPPHLSVTIALQTFRASGMVEYAEPDYLVSAARVPNEIRYTDGSLYHLFNWGQLGGTTDCDIDAAEGWDIAHDASSVIVSVLDTGTRVTHEDLAANLWTNSGEIAGNGIDDDNNGYVDDVHGINARDGNGDLTDTFGHGTHVAGILGAVGNNGIGVVGTAWQTRIMTCKFLDNQLQGSISDALECLEYSRVNGAKVINASWGGTTSNVFGSQALYDAIEALRQEGIIFVAAAGNGALNNDDTPRFYPASFDLDNIISVAATTRDDDLAHFSNHGLNSVDLGAPGYIVWSTWADHDASYATDDGTSMSAPQVAAACALAWALYPTNTYQQIIQRVLAGTDPIPALAGKSRTGGRLNLFKVLNPSAIPPAGNPPILSVRGISGGNFMFRVAGTPNSSFELQTSDDGLTWVPGQTLQVPSSGQVDVSDLMNAGVKFYRAVLK